MGALIRIAESGYVPDGLVRAGIRRLLRRRLRDGSREIDPRKVDAAMAERLRREPIFVETDRADDLLHELPAEFFQLMLGPHLKYSSCYWHTPYQSLREAEAEMLRLTCERAGIANGMAVLDLGCGWGSLSLWIAEHYPRCRLTALSHSKTQARFIRDRAAERSLPNVVVITDDVNRFETSERFDRVVSVEMFEHLRNYGELLSRIARWLVEDGKALVHTFCHRGAAYWIEDRSSDDWMARHCFAGGMMPSLNLLTRFQEDLRVARRWIVGGTHHHATLVAWLGNLDRHTREVMSILEDHYGPAEARLWLVRWRLFLLACAELFSFGRGREWMVAHYLLERPAVVA